MPAVELSPSPRATSSATSAKPTAKPTPSATSVKPSPTPTEAPEPAVPKAKEVSKRKWAKVVKNPDAFIGDRFIIYGEVTQFDSATGDDGFRADTAATDTTEYGYFDGDNTVLVGDADMLEDVVEDDVFRATVTVVGSYSYDTQIGGSTTVPQLEVEKIKVIGNNG